MRALGGDEKDGMRTLLFPPLLGLLRTVHLNTIH